MATAFGRIVDIQRGKADELKKAALEACNLKRNRMVMTCILLLSMFYSSPVSWTFVFLSMIIILEGEKSSNSCRISYAAQYHPHASVWPCTVVK